MHQPKTVTGCLKLKSKMLAISLNEWDNMPPMGSSYSQQTQKDVRSVHSKKVAFIYFNIIFNKGYVPWRKILRSVHVTLKKVVLLYF